MTQTQEAGPVPGPVAQAALEAGLGDGPPTVCTRRRPLPPLPGLITAWAAYMAILIGLIVGHAAIGNLQLMAVIGVIGVLVSIPAFVDLFYRLSGGVPTTYVYPNGLIHVRFGRPRAILWSQVDSVLVAYVLSSKVSFEVLTFDGRRVTVSAAEDGGPVYQRITASVLNSSRPVRPTGRMLSRIASSLVGSKPSKLVVLVVFFAVWALVGVFDEYLRGSAALLLALVAVGALLVLVGPLFGGAVLLGGWSALAVAFFVAWRAAIDQFPGVPAILVIVLTTIVEVLLIAGLASAVRAMERGWATAARRWLARRRGWRFDRTADVPITGLLTAYQLLGVATNATKTTGLNVVRGTIGGFKVTVFDRQREPHRRGDPTQTVWLVTLPVSMPFVSSTFFAYLAQEEKGVAPGPVELQRLVGGAEYATFSDAYFGPRAASELSNLVYRTRDIAVARALATPAVRAIDVGRPWWMLGNQLVLVNGTSQVRPATTSEVRMLAERLVALASAIDWGALPLSPAHPPAVI